MWLSTEAQPRLIIIFRGMIFSTCTLSRMLNLFYYTENYSLIFLTLLPLTMVREAPRTAQCAFATNGWNSIFHKRVVFVNSFSVQADHDRRLNKSCHNQWWRQAETIRSVSQIYIINRVAMDGAFLMQNRKFRLICSILISNCSSRSN